MGSAPHFLGIGPSVEEATEDAARRAVDFAVSRTGLHRKMPTCCIIGETARVGTSPHPVIATQLIVSEEPLDAGRAAGDPRWDPTPQSDSAWARKGKLSSIR